MSEFPENMITRNVDLVICLDATGSMSKSIADWKENALRLHDMIIKGIEEAGQSLGMIRAKVIAFRDYKYDGAGSMDISEFYELTNPEDQKLFKDRLDGIEATGGGDADENGLEAIAYALQSDFTTGKKDRQIIVVCTDSDCLPLGERADSPGYPKDMIDMGKLAEIWTGAAQDPAIKLNPHSARLIVFAPEGTFYEKLCHLLEGAIFRPVDPGSGLKGVDFSSIVKVIVASVAAK